MFQAPLRLLLTLRPQVSAGVLAGTAMSTIVFAATPFLVRGVAIDFDVDVAAVGVISTAQLGGFTVASWGAGRVVRPRRTVLVVALILGIVANLLAAFTGSFAVLVGTRLLSGVSLGLIAWIAWTEVFGDDDRVGDVAVIGPIVGTIASPIVAALIERGGTSDLFLVIAALHLVPLAFVRRTRLTGASRTVRERHRPTRAAAAILAVLGTLTFGGSAVFIYVAVIGRDVVGLSPLAVSLAFSVNAIAGIPSARYRGERKLPGVWMALTGVSAVAVGVLHQPAVFWVALPLWGFSFWMGLPGAFSLLAERSRYPEERAGDAQAVMAAGRVGGPLAGGALYAISPSALGLVGGGAMVAASLALLYIEWRIRPEVLGELVRS